MFGIYYFIYDFNSNSNYYYGLNYVGTIKLIFVVWLLFKNASISIIYVLGVCILGIDFY